MIPVSQLFETLNQTACGFSFVVKVPDFIYCKRTQQTSQVKPPRTDYKRISSRQHQLPQTAYESTRRVTLYKANSSNRVNSPAQPCSPELSSLLQVHFESTHRVIKLVQIKLKTSPFAASRSFQAIISSFQAKESPMIFIVESPQSNPW